MVYFFTRDIKINKKLNKQRASFNPVAARCEIVKKVKRNGGKIR
jgi:hypothetical protein